MPLVTVVTAARNAAAFLPDTVRSIQAQSLRDWDYVIVDDASDDGTAAIAEAFAAADDRIRVQRLASSVGAYAAADQAMREAESRYIARIDADDLAMADRLETQVGILEADSRFAASTGAAQLFDADGPCGLRSVPSSSNGVVKWMLWLRNCLVHSTLMIRKDAFVELGGYGPERVSEDHRLWGALTRRSALAVTDHVLVGYRLHDKQITAAADSRALPERARVTLDHMRRCTDDPWTIDDARDLNAIGEPSHRFGARRALELLRRFEASWRGDQTLTDADRKQLSAFTARRLLRHLRHNMRVDPTGVASASMVHAPQVVTAALRTVTDRSEARWP